MQRPSPLASRGRDHHRLLPEGRAKGCAPGSGATRCVPLTALEVLLLVLYVAAGMVYAVFFTRIRFRLPFDWLLIAMDAMFLARVVGQGVSFDAPNTAGEEMGFLDRLFRGRRTPEPSEARPPVTGPETITEYAPEAGNVTIALDVAWPDALPGCTRPTRVPLAS